jgi:hypothetical protein
MLSKFVMQHQLISLAIVVLLYLWWQGAFAGIGLPSAWVLNGGSNTPAA